MQDRSTILVPVVAAAVYGCLYIPRNVVLWENMVLAIAKLIAEEEEEEEEEEPM
jgi:hypothetical protein